MFSILTRNIGVFNMMASSDTLHTVALGGEMPGAVCDTGMCDSVYMCHETASAPAYDEGLLFCEDSIFKAPDQSTLPERASLFRNHLLKTVHESEVKRVNVDDGGYVFGVLLTLTVLLLVFCLLRKIELKRCVMSVFSMRHTNIMVRESGLKSDILLWPLPFIYYSVLGALGYVVATRLFGEEIYGMLDLPILIGICLLYSFIRYTVIKLLGKACNGEEAVGMYLISGSLFQQIGLVFLIPLTLVGFYVEKNVIWIAGAVAAVVFILRLARGLTIVLSRSAGSKLYLFYYLCIVEIVPILIIAKVLVGY